MKDVIQINNYISIINCKNIDCSPSANGQTNRYSVFILIVILVVCAFVSFIFSDIFFLILLVVQNDRDSGISYAV